MKRDSQLTPCAQIMAPLDFMPCFSCATRLKNQCNRKTVEIPKFLMRQKWSPVRSEYKFLLCLIYFIT